jgi:hypothetical protein
MSMVRLTADNRSEKVQAGSSHAHPWCCNDTATVGLGPALKLYA